MQHIYLMRPVMVLLSFLFSASFLLAAEIQVTSFADSGPGTLRQAVMDADTGDLITFAASLNGTTIILTSGEIVIDKDLSIRGTSRTKTNISGNRLSRIFNVMGGATVTITSLRIRNGFTTESGGGLQNVDGTVYLRNIIVRDCVAGGADPTQGGGGIHNRGKMLVRESMIRGNQATGASGSGGGILNAGEGNLEVELTSITENQANRAGGGIEDASGGAFTTTLRSTSVNNNIVNTSPGNGGGIHLGGASNMSVFMGQVSNNQAGAEGGGIWLGTGTLTIRACRVENNEAMGNDPDMGGGGLYNDGGTMRVDPGTGIVNNRATGASGSGGGILNNVGGTLRINDATIMKNTANRAGGGIEDASGAGSVFYAINARIDSNEVFSSPGNGGGVHVGSNGNLSMLRGSVTGNVAGAEGGGLWNSVGTMMVRGTIVRGNAAAGNDPDQGGGGFYNNGGNLRIDPDTRVIQNMATGTSGSGGGVLNGIGGTEEAPVSGNLRINDATISSNTAYRAGGGVEHASGSVGSAFVINARIDSNEVFSSPGNGGGIHVGGGGNLTILRGSVSNNTAGAEGGGLWNSTGSMTIRGTKVDSNTAAGDDADQGGGGLYNDGGMLVINPSTVVSNNTATGASGSGGGVLNNVGGSLRVNDATVRNNTANRAGGGIEDASGAGTSFLIINARIDSNQVFSSPGNGGGVHVGSDGSVSVVRSSVSNNTAGSEGGGLWNNLGTMTLIGASLDGNTASGDDATNGGGGIFNNGGALTVRNSTVSNNSSTGVSGSGGGLFSVDSTVTVTETMFTGNMANRAGGAVEIADGSFSSTDSDYNGNSTGQAPGNGGAFHVSGMTSVVSFSGGSVKDNTAFNQGGGLWNQMGSTMNVTNVSIMNNNVAADSSRTTDVAGGGIYNQGGILNVTTSTIASNNVVAVNPAETAGGGIANDSGGTLMLMTSTVSGNTASVGGGVANVGTATITNSTITENVAGEAGGYAQDLSLEGDTIISSLTITGTIIADNTAAGDIDFGVGAGAVTSNGYNLIGFDGDDAFPATATDQEGISANLLPLSDNGGTTMTHEPACDETTASPVVDAGNPDDDSDDQLGQAVFGDTRDIGSFEKQTDCPVVSGLGTFAEMEAPKFNSLAQTDEFVTVYPNPVRGNIMNVTLPQSYEGDVTLRILDSSGRIREVVTTSTTTSFPLQLSSFNTGTYLLQVVNGDTVENLRFVVTR